MLFMQLWGQLAHEVIDYQLTALDNISSNSNDCFIQKLKIHAENKDTFPSRYPLGI